MSDADDQKLDEGAALLVGHALTRVRYLGWWRAVPEEPGALVEYVELTMDDGAVLRISTDPDELGVYAISFHEGPYTSLQGPADGIRVLDGRGHEGWGPSSGSGSRRRPSTGPASTPSRSRRRIQTAEPVRSRRDPRSA